MQFITPEQVEVWINWQVQLANSPLLDMATAVIPGKVDDLICQHFRTLTAKLDKHRDCLGEFVDWINSVIADSPIEMPGWLSDNKEDAEAVAQAFAASVRAVA